MPTPHTPHRFQAAVCALNHALPDQPARQSGGPPVIRARVHICLLALLSCSLPAAFASSPENAAQAAHVGNNYTLSNRAIELSFSRQGSHLSGLRIDDRLHGDRLHGHHLAFPEEFTLVLSGGHEIRASQMEVADDPTIQDLGPDAHSPRASEQESGKQICAAFTSRDLDGRVQWCAVLRDGSQYMRQMVTLQAGGKDLAIQQVRMLDFADASARVVGTVKGSPIADDTMFFGFEHPLSISQVHSGRVVSSLKRVLPLPAGQSITYSSVAGVSPAGQMRRSFLAYLERERAHPYRTFLHYNTWFDLGYGNRYDEAGALNRVHAYGEELTRKRQVVLDSFLFDDGWDDPKSLWNFNAGFPDGFTRVRAAAASYGFGIGAWLSPWGGYDEAKQQRVAAGEKAGYETVKGGFALSGRRYYKKFETTCLEMIDKYGVNQFKFDGTGNAAQVVAGSAFDSDFNAALDLIHRLRQEEPGIFINLTTGTYPSPFWLMSADSIWRGGEDSSFAGVGTWRQRWITYRDAQTYRNIVQAGPLFPLNSLMLHGIIYAQHAEHLADDPGHGFAAEVRSYFGTGTELQEIYITPSLLSRQDWDILAEYAKWSRANAGTLRDTHWVGGDPNALQVYGWAAWSPSKGIIVLRNPSEHPQSFSLNVQKAFELPAGAPRQYRTRSPWPGDSAAAGGVLSAGQPRVIHLQPFQVLTLEAYPEHQLLESKR